MPLQIAYRDPSASTSDYVLLPPREHPAAITAVTLGYSERFAAEQIIIVFSGLQFRDKESGKPGRITAWSKPSYGAVSSKITNLIHSITGRPLSEAEALALDMEKLIGIRGWVLVTAATREDGSPSSRYAGFRLADGEPFVPVETLLAEKPAHHVVGAPAKPSASSDGVPEFADPFAR